MCGFVWDSQNAGNGKVDIPLFLLLFMTRFSYDMKPYNH
jgi:hypothetical protein